MKKDRNYLINMYNATSTDNPKGSDILESYEAWLERQLLSRIKKIEAMEEQKPKKPDISKIRAFIERQRRIGEYLIRNKALTYILAGPEISESWHQEIEIEKALTPQTKKAGFK